LSIDLEGIRARHHRVCGFCGGSPDDAHKIEWNDIYLCSCRDNLCPQQLLDDVEARERLLREALVGVADFTLGIDGTSCYCDEDDDGHSDACAAARAILYPNSVREMELK